MIKKNNTLMTVENKSEDEVIAFTYIEIYRKTQPGLNDGLLLMHAVQCVDMLNKIDVLMYISHSVVLL